MAGMRVHTVLPTENLSVISQEYYGSPKYALVIFQHNRDVITDPNAIYPGQELVIPHIHHRIFD